MCLSSGDTRSDWRIGSSSPLFPGSLTDGGISGANRFGGLTLISQRTAPFRPSLAQRVPSRAKLTAQIFPLDCSPTTGRENPAGVPENTSFGSSSPISHTQIWPLLAPAANVLSSGAMASVQKVLSGNNVLRRYFSGVL